MRLRILLSIYIILLSFCNCYEILDPVKRPLLSFFVGPKETNGSLSGCMVNCMDKLKNSLLEFVFGDISDDSRDEICTAYDAASECIRKNDECAEYDAIYSKLTSGFNWACGDASNNPFESLFSCIVKMGKEAREKHNCANVCNISDINIVSESLENNLINDYEPYCGPFSCYLNCTRKQMNEYCPTSGSKLIHVAASAFDELIDELRHTTPTEKKYIMQLVPETCRLFFKPREVTAFRFDEQFVYDLFFMITSRKQRTRNGGVARSEAERIVKELITKMEMEEKTKEPLKWDAVSVSIAAAMCSLLIINIIGLIFVVFWCLTNKEASNGEGEELEMNNQFVEPNIRMKLKLPRMRSAAIKDSSTQEVLELRVPRNGNQLDEEEEEHTVVLPRWKRRRTFSVPLEPRERANSTGSDKFPHIVILRTQNQETLSN